LDVLSANAVLQSLRTAGHFDKLQWAIAGWSRYFGEGVFDAPYSDGASGQKQAR
jgi:hypothetical protein